MMPSPADLSYFYETATTLNVSRAAERLGITQPSLSLAIQRVELALGESIFVRTKRGVTLTQAGKQLQAQTRHLLQSWSEVRTKSLASVHDIQGSYTIGCHPSVALYSLGKFIPQVLAEHPRLEIKLQHELSRKITEGIISHKIDIGIVINPRRHPDLILKKLSNDDVSFWYHKSLGPLATLKKNLEKHILIYDPELAQSQALLKKFERFGAQTMRTIESSNLEVVADLAAHGTGIAILPSRVARRASPDLVEFPGAPVYRDELYVSFRVENKRVATMQYLVEKIVAACSQ